MSSRNSTSTSTSTRASKSLLSLAGERKRNILTSSSSSTERRAVLVGRTGSGKSTLANMLAQGSLDEPQPTPIGHGVKGETLECKTVSGRGWTVIDTVGLGEASCGSVPDKDAAIQAMVAYLNSMKMPFTHLIFVIEKGRLDRLTTVLWKMFVDVFQGAEKNFIVLYTHADQKWMDLQMQEVRREFPECDKFAFANFEPPSDVSPSDESDEDEELEDPSMKMKAELARLEEQLDNLVPPGTWVQPNIMTMTDDQTKEKAIGILSKIARLIKELVREHAFKISLATLSIVVNVLDIVTNFA